MPDNTRLGKPRDSVIYSCDGRPSIPVLGSVLGGMAFVLLFFYLTRAVQGDRQTVFLWVLGFVAVLLFLGGRIRPSITYSITGEGVSARTTVSQAKLWYIAVDEITSIRVLTSTVRLTIPKKTYVVYTGSNSGLFAARVREVRALKQVQV